MNDMDNMGLEISWLLPAKKSSRRNIILVSGALMLIAALSVMVWRDWMLAILLFLGGVILLLPSRSNISRNAKINGVGLKIDEQEVPYEDIKSFWIEFEPGAGAFKEVSFQLKKWYAPPIYLPLGDQNPLPVREILAQFLPEKRHQRSLIDAVMAKLELQ
ncbi:MAG: hypothetical protein Q8P35_01535 [Candidatus Yanofskybacteria bacterium]|nr:hypothetical protein [Candidatus Yanofskybacteria bacterium]